MSALTVPGWICHNDIEFAQHCNIQLAQITVYPLWREKLVFDTPDTGFAVPSVLHSGSLGVCRRGRPVVLVSADIEVVAGIEIAAVAKRDFCLRQPSQLEVHHLAVCNAAVCGVLADLYVRRGGVLKLESVREGEAHKVRDVSITQVLHEGSR